MFSIFTSTYATAFNARGPWRVLSRGVRESLGLCASFPRQAYRRLPTTPTTADVANNGAINATGMWKSGDVLRADNGNASRLERRGTMGRAGWADVERFNEIFATPSGNVPHSRRFRASLSFCLFFFSLFCHNFVFVQ